MHPALRARRLGQLPRHRGGSARRSAQGAPAGVRGEPHRGHLPRQRQRADDRGRAGRSADSPRRGRADPRLRRERNRALHPDRHRHLPCLRGQGRRSGDGRGYCGKRQDEPPQRLQRRGGAAGPQGRGSAVFADAEGPPCRCPHRCRHHPGGAASGRARRGHHRRCARRAAGL